MEKRKSRTFSELTWKGRLCRIKRLAEKILREYPLDWIDLQLLCFQTNPLYRARSSDGKSYVLRMAWPGWRTYEDLHAEAVWLDALSKDTQIGAPMVIRSRNGEMVLKAENSTVPGIWFATLMTWVPGRLLKYYLTEINVYKMGELFAKLHLHTEQWKPSVTFTTKKFESFLSRGEKDALFGGSGSEYIQADDFKVIEDVKDQVEKEYSELDRRDLRVIHCDLWHENIKLHKGCLRPIDFEDTIWGYRLHDMAMGLLDLLETVGYDRYMKLFSIFRKGYEDLLEWPDGNLEMLQMGRMLWQLNHSTRFETKKFPALIRHHVSVFREYFDTGKLAL